MSSIDSRSSTFRQHPEEHGLPIPRGIEVRQLGRDVVTAGEIEGAGGIVLRAGGGLNVDAGTAGGGHPGLGGLEERGSHASALEAWVDDDPVEVRRLLAAGDGTPAGVTAHLAIYFPYKEAVMAGFALGEPVVHQLQRHFDLLGIEETGGADQLLDRSSVRDLQMTADRNWRAGAIFSLLSWGWRGDDGRHHGILQDALHHVLCRE